MVCTYGKLTAAKGSWFGPREIWHPYHEVCSIWERRTRTLYSWISFFGEISVIMRDMVKACVVFCICCEWMPFGFFMGSTDTVNISKGRGRHVLYCASQFRASLSHKKKPDNFDGINHCNLRVWVDDFGDDVHRHILQFLKSTLDESVRKQVRGQVLAAVLVKCSALACTIGVTRPRR